MDYFLGLDGGGTKTAACLLDADGREIGRGLGGPCNIATGDDDLLRGSLLEAARSVFRAAGLGENIPLTAVCAGVAGYSARRRRVDFARLLAQTLPAAHDYLEPDFVIAYWGATEGEPGVIVSAGTGAVIYGRNATGQDFRIDGRGFMLGDRGSGFWIGQFVLRRLITRWELDGIGGHLKELDRNIMAAIGAEDMDDLIEWAYRDFQPARIASLAPIIGELAAAGDEFAFGALYSAGSLLRYSVNRVFRRLDLPASTSVYTLGSLWNIEKGFREGFHRGNDQAPPPPALSLLPPRHDAAYGAALLAMQRTISGTNAGIVNSPRSS